jgi:hypothetical protein
LAAHPDGDMISWHNSFLLIKVELLPFIMKGMNEWISPLVAAMVSERPNLNSISSIQSSKTVYQFRSCIAVMALT